METSIINLITDCLVPTATAVAGWFAGRRKRQGDAIHNMQESIELLTRNNKKLLDDLAKVNDEVLQLRRENTELKLSVDQLCRENSQLKTEVQDLRKQMTQAPA